MGWVASRRSEVRRLKKRLLGGDMVSIKQQDGTTFTCAKMDAFKETFGYFSDSLCADGAGEPRPEPPAVLKAVANAKNRREAYERVMGGYTHIPVAPEVLIVEGRFEPVSLVAGMTYEEVLAAGGIEDLSEP